MTAPHQTAPSVLSATLVAAVAVAIALAAAVGLLWPDLQAAAAGFDFNAALFEDFLGPYLETAQRLADGSSEPAEGYLYPAYGALLLVPFSALGPVGASWLCAAILLGSTLLLLASAFMLVRPERYHDAAALGAATFLSHGVAHGAYWGQASLVVVALSAAGFALWARGRSTPGAALIGGAAAIKLTPRVFLVAPIATRNRRAFAGARVTFVTCAVLAPLAVLGADGFASFHGEGAQRLGSMAEWVSTPEGGRGSQNPGAILARALGAPAWWIGQGLGDLAALALLVAAMRTLRADADVERARAFPLLAAIPWLVVGPPWPHALAWLPLAWWVAWRGERSGTRVKGLVIASAVLGSVPMLRLVGDPEVHARLGLPAAAAFLAVLALLPGLRWGLGRSEKSKSGPAVSPDGPG